jgi:WD40 repeat protein/tRNA A-37 threonylcarbamoyl transferase component Bud32
LPGLEVLGELGRGAMGVVFRARQRFPHRLVALKVLGSTVPPGRVRTEVEAAARLQHANIVAVFEVKEHGGRTCLILEYVEGGNLARKIEGRPQPPRDAARLVETLARAMAYAHERGVIHRDLKPSNVLLAGPPDAPLGQCQPKISDFGLAKLLAGTGASLTRTTDILGTPSYMAPEQAGGHGTRVSPATDVYALGAILYELLTGRPPFLGETVLDTLAQMRTQEPVSPRHLQPKVPRDLETICLKCLEKAQARRYGSAEELADDLARFQKGETIRARPAGLLERARKWARRQPALAALLGVCVLAVGLLVAGGLYANQQVRLQRDLAEGRADELHEQLKRTRRLLFTAQLLRVGAVWQRDPIHGQQMLEDPGLFPADLRDFAWGVLYGKCKRYRRALPGHAKRVSAVAFCPAGKRGAPPLLASGGHDGKVKLWDARTGAELASLHEHTSRVSTVAFSPNGRTLASGGYDGTIKLWDVAKRTLLASLTSPAGPVAALAFSPDGKTLAANGGAGKAGRLILWDVRTQSPRFRLPSSTQPHCNVVFSPDGKLVLCGAPFEKVRVWDVATGTEQNPIGRQPAKVTCIAYSPDGATLAAGLEDGSVQLWDGALWDDPQHRVPLRRLRPESSKSPVSCLVFSRDGQVLAAGFEEKLGHLFRAETPRFIQLWDLTNTGVPLDTLRGHRGSVCALAFSPDGKTLASGGGGADCSVRLWDYAVRPERLQLHRHDGATGSVAQSPDGRILAWATRRQKRPMRCVELTVWDVERKKKRWLLRGHTESITCLALSPDGRLLVSAAGGKDDPAELFVWDLGSGRLRSRLPGPNGLVPALAFSPDGTTLASACWDGTVSLWDVQGGKLRHRLTGHARPVTCVAFSADGKTLASGEDQADAGSELKLWDASTGEHRRDLAGHSGRITCLAFSPDGKTLASGGRDGVIKLWDLKESAEPAVLSPGTREVTCLAYSPDGQTLASGGLTSVVKLWDALMGQERVSLPGHEPGVCMLAFTGDGRTLGVASSLGHSVRWWHAALPER